MEEFHPLFVRDRVESRLSIYQVIYLYIYLAMKEGCLFVVIENSIKLACTPVAFAAGIGISVNPVHNAPVELPMFGPSPPVPPLLFPQL
jgi:hypothetical protein